MTLPTLHAVERAICCPSGRCSSPGDCYADDRTRSYPVHIRDAAEAVLRLVGDGWRPIAEAPTERGAVVDLWVRSKMTEVTGRGYRIADCHYDGKGSWLHQGQWVTGRHFFDEDGERCFDPYDTSRDATVATHFRMKPGGPLETPHD